MIERTLDNRHRTSLDLHTICPACGSRFWNVQVVWDPDDYTIGMYLTEQECSNCGLHAKTPTEADLKDPDGVQ